MLDPSERLRNAIIEGNLSITKRILLKNPELWLNIDTKNGWNNLHYSSYNGNYLICFHLISFINQSKKLNNDLANVLLNHNDMLSFNKLSALHLTIQAQHLQTLHYLLQEFPGTYWLNHRGGEQEQTPLQYCCVYGFPEGLKLLLEKGADYNIVDKLGNNLLHLAFEYGEFECIKIFLQYLFNLNGGSKLIKKFEKDKNHKGWLPVELSINFKLTNDYKSFKRQLSLNLSELNLYNFHNGSLIMESGSQSGTLGNSTATSDLESIRSVALDRNIKQDLEDLEQKSIVDSLSIFNNSTPSPNKVLSSPILSLNEFKRSHSQSLPTQAEEDLPSMLRQRANTTVTTNFIPPPLTPIIKKTTSLKSLTISPSIRLNTENDTIDLEADSITSSSSPVKISFPITKTSSTNSVSAATSSNNSGANSLVYDKHPYNTLDSSNKIEEQTVVDSPSSIAAKIAFNSSRSSRSSMSSRTRPRDISTADSPVKLAHSSSTVSLRTVSQQSATGSESPSKHKNSISSISFSRIR